MILTIKKWLSSIVTVLLLVVLFGLIFVKLELVVLTEAFVIELIIVATLTTIIRFFWYNEGEDRALREQDLIDMKTNYGKFVQTAITSQEDLDDFVEELNTQNRESWVFRKLKGKTKKTCDNYDELYQELLEKSFVKVPVITSTQILTRSAKYETINAKDYTQTKKLWFQSFSLVSSICMSVLLGILAYKELLLNWESVFRYLSYVFSMVWALVTSLWNGYKTYRNSTIDHISRLTMIINRYSEWSKGGKKWQAEEQATTKSLSNNKA